MRLAPPCTLGRRLLRGGASVGLAKGAEHLVVDDGRAGARVLRQPREVMEVAVHVPVCVLHLLHIEYMYIYT